MTLSSFGSFAKETLRTSLVVCLTPVRSAVVNSAHPDIVKEGTVESSIVSDVRALPEPTVTVL